MPTEIVNAFICCEGLVNLLGVPPTSVPYVAITFSRPPVQPITLIFTPNVARDFAWRLGAHDIAEIVNRSASAGGKAFTAREGEFNQRSADLVSGIDEDNAAVLFKRTG